MLTYAVNEKHMLFNIQKIRAELPPATKFIAVVKNNAFAHGIQRVVPIIDSYIDGYATVTLQEALVIRSNNSTKRIFQLYGCDIRDVQTYYDYSIEPTISDIHTLQKLQSVLANINRQLSVHLFINSGWTIGLDPSNKNMHEIDHIVSKGNVQIASVYHHYANVSDRSRCARQQKAFEHAVSYLRGMGHSFQIHSAASPAFCTGFDLSYDAVRIGDLMYGVTPHEGANRTFNIKDTLTISTPIIDIQHIKKGSLVFYGSSYVADKNINLAFLPVGYADGFIKKMIGASVLLQNNLYPVIGDISMNISAVDITGAKNIHIGDTAVIIGQQGNKSITLKKIAKHLSLSEDETLMTLGERHLI